MTYQITAEKFLTEDEFEYMERTAWRYLPRLDALFVLTALYTGARRVELLRMTDKDLGEGKHSPYLFIRHPAKGSLPREIPLIHRQIYDYLKALPPGLLFPKSVRQASYFWENDRPRSAHHKGIHAARHTFAVRLYDKTKDVRLVQYCLGHKSIVNTEVYKRYGYSQDEILKAMKGGMWDASHYREKKKLRVLI